MTTSQSKFKSIQSRRLSLFVRIEIQTKHANTIKRHSTLNQPNKKKKKEKLDDGDIPREIMINKERNERMNYERCRTIGTIVQTKRKTDE